MIVGLKSSIVKSRVSMSQYLWEIQLSHTGLVPTLEKKGPDDFRNLCVCVGFDYLRAKKARLKIYRTRSGWWWAPCEVCHTHTVQQLLGSLDTASESALSCLSLLDLEPERVALFPVVGADEELPKDFLFPRGYRSMSLGFYLPANAVGPSLPEEEPNRGQDVQNVQCRVYHPAPHLFED